MKESRWMRLTFGAYYAIMIYLLFLQRLGHAQVLWEQKALYWQYVGESLNLLPSKTVAAYLAAMGHDALINLGGNIVMFVPLGFFVPSRWESLHSFRKSMLACALMILAVELAQLFTLCGRGDIDDFLLNMLGAALGYGVFALWEKIRLQ